MSVGVAALFLSSIQSTNSGVITAPGVAGGFANSDSGMRYRHGEPKPTHVRVVPLLTPEKRTSSSRSLLLALALCSWAEMTFRPTRRRLRATGTDTTAAGLFPPPSNCAPWLLPGVLNGTKLPGAPPTLEREIS